MRLITYLFIFIFPVASLAQDLNARVQVLSPQIQTSNKRPLEVLETAIRDFLNGRKWSTDNFQPQERINCNFVITITEWNGSSNFKAEAQIQSGRPVFNTTYQAVILNISDKEFAFNYTEGQPLDFSDQQFSNNLSSLLAFYAYIIMGMDYDTFSKFGGTPFYEKAQAVVNTAQSTGFSGWKAFESLSNRYWLVENLQNKAYLPLRDFLYEYHRNGLDLLADDPVKGRKEILNQLPGLQKIDKQKQGAMLNQLFFTAKADELVNVISAAAPTERVKAFNILSSLDPANAGKYELLRKTR